MAVSPCISKADPKGRELVRHGTLLFPAACYHDDLTRDPAVAGTERFILERGTGFSSPPASCTRS